MRHQTSHGKSFRRGLKKVNSDTFLAAWQTAHAQTDDALSQTKHARLRLFHPRQRLHDAIEISLFKQPRVARSSSKSSARLCKVYHLAPRVSLMVPTRVPFLAPRTPPRVVIALPSQQTT
jgi:hypothetical protein